MDDQIDQLKELKLQNKKLQRENKRLQMECDILKNINEKVSRTQLFFQRDSQRQLCYNNQLLKTMPYILVMVNENLETVMASDVFFQRTKVNRDVLHEGMKLEEAVSGILHRDELEPFVRRCQSVLERQGTDSYLLSSHSGEKELFYQVDISYYLALNEEAKGLCIILSDMTEIMEAKKRAENADKAKSRFLANMSHEIRTPINAVLGMNEMILHEAGDQSILEYASNIRSAGRTLLYLINSILDFSKIEEGKMEIIPVDYDTVEVMDTLAVPVSDRARQKGLELSVELDPTLPAALIGDDVRLAQVIMNLLTNAVKYTEKGSVSFKVSAGERHGDEIHLLVSVSDTGIGIRREDIPRLFENFERLEEIRNRNIEGTGLGISIVTRLLEMMGSRLEVESVYGKGSVFSFDIVQKIADDTPIGDSSRRRNEIRRTNESETLHAGKSRILVVDDNEMNLKVAGNLFKLFDIVPDMVYSGFEAIERLREGASYHMIFLDHMMPKMDGIETLKLMKEEKLLGDSTPVIALTANAVNGAKEQYLSAGFNDYISKPIEVKELEQMLERFLPQDLYSVRKGADGGEAVTDRISALQAAGFDTTSGMRYAAGDAAFYIELVEGFADGCERKLPVIRSDYQKKDWTDYQTRVHALKSTARQIGANELSDLALAQELAAKEKNEEAIMEGAENLLQSYEDVCLAIRKVLGETDIGTTADPGIVPQDGTYLKDEKITPEILRSILSDARGKIHDYEAESAQEVLRPLEALPEAALAPELTSVISYQDFTEALKGITDALADFDITLSQERLDELLKALV